MNLIQYLHHFFYPLYIRNWAERFFKIKSGQTVVDAGAYIGGFTLYAAKKVGKSGKIIAFEPDPINFAVLKKNVVEANLKNVILIKKALSNSIKEVELESANHFSSIVIKTSNRPTFKVQQTTLDQEMKKLCIKKVDFIKMNVEGSEVDTLKGGTHTLIKTNHLAISCHKINGVNTAELVQPILEKSGFKVKFLRRKKLIIDFGHIDAYGFR